MTQQTTYRRYDYQRGLRLEVQADWAQSSSQVWYRWSERGSKLVPTSDGCYRRRPVWIPFAEWQGSCFQVADFRHDHRAALRELWRR
jgi:hypothetical protein